MSAIEAYLCSERNIMSTTPALVERNIASVLKNIGFIAERQRGSHLFLKHPDGRATVIPIHSGETIGPGLFTKILREVHLSKDEFFQHQHQHGDKVNNNFASNYK